ncbi:MAG: cyclic nucleotide-binding domain-containing protein [Rhodospirillales bacterium]|nr:cyclic nucleotide-binding domain-containing protein [Rhodospirillales bacterium]MCW8862170.1 cyclic nucleotide-binding domain-containing protein [Rhodospirillales bacterium]MCW8952304.1 cyclic nucleotide-binding domain-containing protein [Rhodospirillales bacterium]
MSFERIMLLKRVPFFSLLRTDQLRWVSEALDPVFWIEGERVFDKGESGNAMFLIITGCIGISLDDNVESKSFVAELKDGDCFGEMGILDDQTRSATAHVLSDTQGLSLSKEKLHGLLMSYPELGIGMLKAMSQRQRATNAKLTARNDSSHVSATSMN